MRDPRTGKRFSARSTLAGEAYALAVDRILGSESGVLEALEESIAQDPRFCMALAARYMLAKEQDEQDAADYRLRALAALEDSEEWERAHIGALFLFLDDPSKNLAATEHYVSIFGYDLVVISQFCDYLTFYGGASKLERVQRILEAADSRLKTDWAYLARLGFAVSEAGDSARGLAIVERALEQRTSSLYVMHSYAHVLYQQHLPERSSELLLQWLERYRVGAQDGALLSHIYWHLALCQLELGNSRAAWRYYREYAAPEVSSCDRVLKLADAGGFLLRAFLSEGPSVEVSKAERALCDQYESLIAHPFIALHVSVILLVAGDRVALVALRSKLEQLGTASGRVSKAIVDALLAFLEGDYQRCCSLTKALSSSDRISIGGNYIERVLLDLLEERAELLIGYSV